MAIAPLILKKNDLQPYYTGKVVNGSGSAVDLSSVTIRCTMKNTLTGDVIIDRSNSGSNVTSGLGGLFEWQWQTSETATLGKFHIEFEMSPSGGGKFTVPPDNSAIVIIHDSLDTI